MYRKFNVILNLFLIRETIQEESELPLGCSYQNQHVNNTNVKLEIFTCQNGEFTEFPELRRWATNIGKSN